MDRTISPVFCAATHCTDFVCPRKILNALILIGLFIESSVSNFHIKGKILISKDIKLPVFFFFFKFIYLSIGKLHTHPVRFEPKTSPSPPIPE